jgi:hypothetical protein
MNTSVFYPDAKQMVLIKGKNAVKRKMSNLLDSWYFIVLMTMITIYALFFDDLRVILFTKNEDDIFYAFTTFSFVCFSFEIIITCYCKPDKYPYTFFFWLDVISTVSLIPDIGWIMDDLTKYIIE